MICHLPAKNIGICNPEKQLFATFQSKDTSDRIRKQKTIKT